MQSAGRAAAGRRPDGPRLIISGERRIWSGLRDLGASFLAWRIWMSLGLTDITSRYRRTVLGPFWITLSLAVQAVAIGAIFSGLMGVPAYDYLPYVTLGLITWQFLASTVGESSSAFSVATNLIRNFPLPLGVHVLRTVWRNILTLLHHAVVLVFIAPFTRVEIGLTALLAIPGLALIVINACWIAITLALVSVRFRDVPPMITNAVQMLFFVTPVIWSPERLGAGLHFLTWNPAYHLIEIVRSPLLGEVPALVSFAVAISFAIIGWACTLLLYGRYHWRVAYWV